MLELGADGHQLRGARIHRDMMLVSSVCRRALGCEWGGGWCAHSVGITSGWLPRIWGSITKEDYQVSLVRTTTERNLRIYLLSIMGDGN